MPTCGGLLFPGRMKSYTFSFLLYLYNISLLFVIFISYRNMCLWMNYHDTVYTILNNMHTYLHIYSIQYCRWDVKTLYLNFWWKWLFFFFCPKLDFVLTKLCMTIFKDVLRCCQWMLNMLSWVFHFFEIQYFVISVTIYCFCYGVTKPSSGSDMYCVSHKNG